MFKVVILLFIVFYQFSGFSKDFEVGVIWQDDSGMGNRVFEGFKQANQKYGFEVSEFNSKGDKQKFIEIFNDCQNKLDALVVLRSKGLVWASRIEDIKKPVFAGACNHPGGLLGARAKGLFKDKQFYAVTYYIPAFKHVELIKTIFPEVKTIGFLYQKNHPGGERVELPQTMRACKKNNLNFLPHAVHSKAGEGSEQECVDATKELIKNGAELIIISNTNSVYMEAESICSSAGEIPVYSYAKKGIEKGALLGMSSSDQVIGEIIAYKINKLKNNEKIEKTIDFDPIPQIYINKNTHQKLQIQVPDDLNSKIIYL